MKTRSELEKIERSKARQAQAADISASTVAKHSQPFQPSSYKASANVEDPLKDLKIRVATAAYHSLRELGFPVHNARVAEVSGLQQDDVMRRTITKKAAFSVKFDIPYSSPEGRGVRTASIPVSFVDGKLLVGKEFSYAGARYAATAQSLGEIMAAKEPAKHGDSFTIVAVLTPKGHEIIGSTSYAPAVVASLKTAGYRVAFRNPQDALNIEVTEPFYEILPGTGYEDAKKIVSHWLTPTKRVAQRDPLKAPASTTPVPSTPELEKFRQEVQNLQRKKAELEAMAKDYYEGLIKKEGFSTSAALNKEIAELTSNVMAEADRIGAPLLQLASGNLLALRTSVRVNDVAWKTYLDKLATHAGKLVAKIYRYANLFRKMTVTHAYEEIAPEQKDKVFKDQLLMQKKIDDYLGEQKNLSEIAPKYLLNTGTGTPVVKSAQSTADEGVGLLEFMLQELADTNDTTASVVESATDELMRGKKVQEVEDEYPLPNPAKTARKRSDKPIIVGSFDRPLSELEKAAVQNFKFSAAGEGRHWAFHRSASKKGHVYRGLIAKYVAKGFSEEEAFGELKRKAQSAGKASYIEVFATSNPSAKSYVESADLRAVGAGGYVLGDADDLVALPAKGKAVGYKAVYFYIGGRLFDEQMKVIEAAGRYFINYEENAEKLS